MSPSCLCERSGASPSVPAVRKPSARAVGVQSDLRDAERLRAALAEASGAQRAAEAAAAQTADALRRAEAQLSENAEQLDRAERELTALRRCGMVYT